MNRISLFLFVCYLSALLVQGGQTSNSDNDNNCLFAVCECDDEGRVNCRGFELTTIPAFASANRTRFSELSLSNNLIEHLDADQLAGLDLKHFWLRNNGLTTISEHAFRGVLAIESLSLQANYLEQIEPAVFEPIMMTLKVLNLNLNQLQKAPSLPNFEFLHTYNLSYNQINDLKPTIFPKSLKTLALDNNQIEEIHESTFDQLSNLEFLYLQSNQISTIDVNAFQHLHSLIILDLSHNSLVRIASEWFYRLQSIEHVLLAFQHNPIEYIEDFAFDIESPRQQTSHYVLDGNEFDNIQNKAFCKTSTTQLNRPNNEIISFNESIFNHVNPCIFERVSSAHMTSFTIRNASHVHFDCNMYSHLYKNNFNVTYEPNLDCPVDKNPIDVCARETMFNCYETVMLIEVFKMDVNRSYQIVKSSNTSESMTFHSGDSIIVDCVMQSINNDMVPEVEWRYVNGSSIVESNDDPNSLTEVFRKSYRRSLRFDSVQRGAIGQYVCGSKVDGTTNLEFNLNVTSVCGTPVITSVIIYEFRSYIKWTVTDFGGLDVTGFHLNWRKNSSSPSDFHTYSVKLHKYEDEIYVPFRLYNTSIISIYLENSQGLSNKSAEYSVANTQVMSDRAKCMEELRQVFDKCLRFKKYDNEPNEIESLVLE